MNADPGPGASHHHRGIPGCLGFVLLLFLAQARPAPAEIVISTQPTETKTNDTSGIVVPPPEDGTEPGRLEVLEFLNGDKLHGSFVSLDAKRGVLWRHPAMKQPLEINLAGLAKVKMDRTRATNATAAAGARREAKLRCSVRLTNHDELQGELLSLDAERLTFGTWYAGTLNIPRKLIDSIVPGQGPGTSVYEGPTGLEGWTMRSGGMRRGPNGTGPWRFSNGAFVCTTSGSIGREFKLPAMANVEFDLNWRRYLQFAVSVFTDNLESYGGNAYMFQFNNVSAYVQRMSRNGDSSSFGQAELPGFNLKTKAHFSIRANKEQKTLFLLVDGVLVKQWTDTADFSPGNGLLFLQQGQSFIKISDLRISEWDGKLEASGAPAAPAKVDSVRLANTDKITGTLQAIRDGKLSFKTSFATLDVPMERVTEIDFSDEGVEKLKPAPGAVRAQFAEGGSVTVQIEHWDDRQVAAASPSFGKAKFAPLAFSILHFNLDQQKTESEASETDEAGAGDALIVE